MFAPLGSFWSFLLAVGIVVVLCERFSFFRTWCGIAVICACYALALSVVITVFEAPIFSLFDAVFGWIDLNGGYVLWSRVAGGVAAVAIAALLCLWFFRRSRTGD